MQLNDENTFGDLYHKLVLTTGEIPIGVFRTVEKGSKKEFLVVC